jgi:hypothetical protein
MMSLWRQTDLPELAATLITRPGHETVRTLVADILRNGFGAAYAALDHEVRLPEVRGRADMLFGATVFEFQVRPAPRDGRRAGAITRLSR